jgi:hypothetical protein
MSLLSAGAVGVYRDLAGPRQPITSAARATPARATPAVESVASFGQLLVAQIPSEALLAYTTLLAIFSAGGGSYKVGRWILYGISLVVCAAVVLSSYLAKRDYGFRDDNPAGPKLTAVTRHLPLFPATTAVLSMAVYGLTVPGSALQLSMSATGFAITSGCLAVGGGVMMSIFAPLLGKGNNAQVNPAETSPKHNG